MAHARRKFDEAKTTDPERAHAGLAWIGRLYQIEREAKEQIGESIKCLTKEGQLDATEWGAQSSSLPRRSPTGCARSNRAPS